MFIKDIKMRKIWLFPLLFLCYHTGHTQYTELINSKRPGFSDSPFSVGTNVLQFEGGFFYKNQNNEKDHIKSFGSDLMVRYGKFFKRLEMNLNVRYQHDDVTFKDTSFSMAGSHLSQLNLGVKFLVYTPTYTDKSKEIRSWKKRHSFDWKRLIPAVAVYAGGNFPVTKNYVGGYYGKFIKDSWSPKFAIYTQNNLSKKLVFIANLVADKLFTEERENSYILTATYSFNEKWSVFAEHQGFFKKNIPNDYQYGGGLAYLFNRNLQVDLAARTINDRDGTTFSVNTGLSWRLDRHKDDYIIVDAYGNKTKPRKKSNFFSRLFSKKDPKQRKVKRVKAGKKKIKKLKPKKTKAQKQMEKETKRKAKEEKKRAKEEKKRAKKERKNQKRNYEPPTNDQG
ncbi:MAG: hypothetical protein CSA39_00010 [Flavobacteriales bacterium]|nr:MAG: hypothetical protein CSA39_00010 [Flavobacteriales bacterium]